MSICIDFPSNHCYLNTAMAELQTQELTLIDTHAHLEPAFFNEPLSKILEEARKNGVKYIFAVGEDEKASEWVIKSALQHENIYAIIGLHPHHAHRFSEYTLTTLKQMADNSKIIAIGETGLDFYKNNSSRDDQIRAFTAQAKLAKDMGKTLVIHSREAYQECLQVLRDTGTSKALFHCFTGSKEIADEIVARGYYLSFSGIVTFKKSDQLKEIALRVSMDNFLLETDSPFLSPEPVRSQKNRPAFVRHTAEYIARLRNISLAELSQKLAKNAERLFNIKLQY